MNAKIMLYIDVDIFSRLANEDHIFEIDYPFEIASVTIENDIITEDLIDNKGNTIETDLMVLYRRFDRKERILELFCEIARPDPSNGNTLTFFQHSN